MKHHTPSETLWRSRKCSSGFNLLLTLTAFGTAWLAQTAGAVGYWTALSSQPSDGIGVCLLMSDGTVLAEGSSSNWWRLTPDSSGHYINGSWSSRHSSTWGHQTGSSAVLQNGNVFVAGGEHGGNFASVELYYPVSDSWSVVTSSAYFGNIEDGNAMLLSNGQVLIEPQESSGIYANQTFTFNPANNLFTETGSPLNGIGEATWVKLPNDHILIIDSDNSSAGATTAEQFDPNTGNWTTAVSGGTVPNIWPNVTGTGYVSEMGPAFLLPNGNAIFFGGNGVTAVYNNGIWSQSATIPNGLGMKDAGGIMMVNGKILLAVCPTGVNSDPSAINGVGPTSFYEYDYTANGGAGGYTLAPTAGGTISGAAGGLNFLQLPDGTVLLSGLGSQLYVYHPDNSPLAAGQPTISKVQWNPDGTLHITGTLFNGISQGGSYGDDAQMDSNYPLVRFTDGSGNVYYGTTYNWSSTSVQTGGRVVTTEVTVPPSVLWFQNGFALQVVANGNASAAVGFDSPVWVDFVNYNPIIQNGQFLFPYPTTHQGVSAVFSGGTIAIDASSLPSTGHETTPYTISTPMTIISVYGPSTIGH
jgi:hypothetical protein